MSSEMNRRTDSYDASASLFTLVLISLVGLVLTVVVWRAGSSLAVSMITALPLLAFVGAFLYQGLFLVANRLVLVRGRLEWEAPMAHGERDVHELVSLWSRWPFTGVVEFRFSDGSKLRVKSDRGFGAFARQLVADYPDVHLNTGILDRF